MKHLRWLLLLIPCYLIACATNKPASNQPRWVPLFNGQNLDNWTPKIAGHAPGQNFGNTFRVTDGILSTRYDAYEHFDNRFGALFYNKIFKDFRLRVEYRFAGDTVAGAPSWGYRDGGVQYYCQSPESMGLHQPFPVCLEYNLLGGNGANERPTGEICANGMYVLIDGKKNESYCTPPTQKITVPGDQWAVAEIEVRNGKVTHFVNGQPVISFSEPHYDTSNALAIPFISHPNASIQEGYISLQSNSHPMDFRKIEILEY